MAEFPDTRDSLLVQVKDSQNRKAWERFARLYQPVIYRLARQRGLHAIGQTPGCDLHGTQPRHAAVARNRTKTGGRRTMSLMTPTCDSNQLEALLECRLNAEQERDVMAHLGVCERCRHELESRAAEPALWDEVKTYLTQREDEPAAHDGCRWEYSW